MSKEALEASLRTLDILLIVFGIVVAVGVTGESIFGFMHWRKSNQLHSIQSTENLAQEREIGRLRRESESTRLDTAKANERAASAEQRAAEANQKAEGERLARLKIEERLAARRIGPKQYHDLVGALSPFRGSNVEVTKLGDLEASRFADDIVLLLTESGWHVARNSIGTMGSPVYGLHCTVDESPSGKALGAAFKTLPTAQVESSANLPISGRIFVGLKPPP